MKKIENSHNILQKSLSQKSVCKVRVPNEKDAMTSHCLDRKYDPASAQY